MYKASSASRRTSEASSVPFAWPAPPLIPLWPGPGGVSNANAIDGFGKVATEWLDFVHRRLLEDVRLAQRVAAVKSPAEAWGLYADFVQQGVQDYWNEYAAMTRLTSELAGAGVGAAEAPGQDASGAAAPAQKAA